MSGKKLVESLRRHRLSALIDGTCIGIGIIFIVLGVVMPVILQSHEQIVNGLLAIIGGILVTITGGIMEVYHRAGMPLESSQDKPLRCSQDVAESRWGGLFLRCDSCSCRTGHVLTNVAHLEKGQVEKTYECVQCGEAKKIYDPAQMEQIPMQPKTDAQPSITDQ